VNSLCTGNGAEVHATLQSHCPQTEKKVVLPAGIGKNFEFLLQIANHKDWIASGMYVGAEKFTI
jgi:hypothetical protein